MIRSGRVLGVVLAVIVGLNVATMVAQGAAFALGPVRIPQPVLADGQRLEPGMYAVRIADEFIPPNPGQSPTAVRVVEFIRDGRVVARDAAEVVTAETSVVGTAGSPAHPRVEMLKGGEFLRISSVHDGMRYLIHLPVAK